MRRLESVPEVEDEREKSACSALPHMYCNKKERKWDLVWEDFDSIICANIIMNYNAPFVGPWPCLSRESPC